MKTVKEAKQNVESVNTVDNNITDFLSICKKKEAQRYVKTGKVYYYPEELVDNVIECKIIAYEGEYGTFMKLYLDFTYNDEIMSICEGDYSGIMLDKTSTRMYKDLEPGEEIEVDPTKILIWEQEDTHTGKISKKIRMME